MSRWSLVLLIAMWCGSLLAVAEWAGAQRVRRWVPLSEPAVLTGDEIGFPCPRDVRGHADGGHRRAGRGRVGGGSTRNETGPRASLAARAPPPPPRQ